MGRIINLQTSEATNGGKAILELLKQNREVLVVGSGPVGIGVARRLAERGFRATVLEAGSAITEPPGSHIRNQWRLQQDPDGYFAAIDSYLPPVTDPAKTSPLPGANESTLVGGQGILWTNNCPRAAEFERWEVMTPGEWEQRYAEAERMLQVLPTPSANSRRAQRIRKRLQEALGDQRRTVSDLPFSGKILPSGEIHYKGPADILAAATEEVGFSQVDHDRMRAMETDVQGLARQLGRWRRGCEGTWIPHGNAHMVGTCRMDRPGWEGVADTAGRVHGFDNLYLASVGLFSVPIAENPTLSAVALALKSCDQLAS